MKHMKHIRRLIWIATATVILTIQAGAITGNLSGAEPEMFGLSGLEPTFFGLSEELPDDLAGAVPEEAWEFLDRGAEYAPDTLASGTGKIFQSTVRLFVPLMRQGLRGAVSVLLAVILCTAAHSAQQTKELNLVISLTGALSITALSAGNLEQLIGSGWKTIEELTAFSRALLPALAAATAVSGAVTTASFQQAGGLFLAQLLLELMDGFFMPMIYVYIGLLTASAILPEERLSMLAAGLKRVLTAILTGALLLFTVYLSVFRIVTGSADIAAVRTARAAMSNAIPVVGGILAETSEAILAGAGMLKNTIGIFGMLVVLAACVQPFLKLGIQYLIYQGISLFASAAGMPELCRLVEGLSGAFGLVLGMTGGCALLVLISILSFVSAVAP